MTSSVGFVVASLLVAVFDKKLFHLVTEVEFDTNTFNILSSELIRE